MRRASLLSAILLWVLLAACGGKVAGDGAREAPEEPAPPPAEPPPLSVASAPACADLPDGTYTAEVVRKKGGDLCGPVREEKSLRIDNTLVSPEWTCASLAEPSSCTFETTCTLAWSEASLVRQERYVTTTRPPYVRWAELRKFDAGGKLVMECIFEETLTPRW
jgi:hypothetical protein